jgi:short subunit dehydrogenase-like uncharacterized protein
MTARIVVLGATGYTGRLTVEALVRRGQRPVLAARTAAKLDELAGELGGDLDVAVADVSRPESVRAVVGAGDVLVSTVGPFVKWGDPALEAALRKGAHYVDSNGEPHFTRRVFEQYGPRATQAGIGMLTAFGWECVLGNLAGALAVREAGEAAVRVDTGYFYTAATGFSGGTRASFADAMVRPSFAYRDGAIRTVRGADRYRTMQRPLHAMSRAGFAASKVPGMRALYEAGTSRYVKGSTGGPAADERARAGVHVVGMAYDDQGAQFAEVHLSGVEGYEFTGAILAWSAERVAAGGLEGAGALGPVQAFGIDELEAGCRQAGVARV